MPEQIALNVDCMEYMRSLPDKQFDIAIVDPVYGDVKKGGYMKNKMNSHKYSGPFYGKHIDYHLAMWDQQKTGKDYFDELFRISKNQIIWGGNYFAQYLRSSTCWIVWDKRHPPEAKISYADAELAWSSFDTSVRIFRYRWNGFLQEDMKHKEKKIHPTQKPVALYEWLLKHYAKPGDKIIDTHLGSGSSRIACHKLGFDFVGLEIDKTYFDMQEERWNKYTGQINLFDAEEDNT